MKPALGLGLGEVLEMGRVPVPILACKELQTRIGSSWGARQTLKTQMLRNAAGEAAGAGSLGRHGGGVTWKKSKETVSTRARGSKQRRSGHARRAGECLVWQKPR